MAAKLAFVIAAEPERFALAKPEIVLLPAAMVLLVKTSLPASVARVPAVGSVTPVVLERVSVRAKDPEIAIVLAELFEMPVPPFWGRIGEVKVEMILPLKVRLLLPSIAKAKSALLALFRHLSESVLASRMTPADAGFAVSDVK